MTTCYEIRTAVCEANSLASLCQELCRELGGLIAEPAATAGWSRVRVALAALPLTTREYAVSVNRLSSAEQYTSHRELGAAKFELTLLARKLAALAKEYAPHWMPGNEFAAETIADG